jgi:hypothetical protein
MLAGICVGIAVLAWLLRASAEKGPLRLDVGELTRLRSLSDKLHREEVQPFE